MTRAIVLLALLALGGCTGCLVGREYVFVGSGQHVCLDP